MLVLVLLVLVLLVLVALVMAVVLSGLTGFLLLQLLGGEICLKFTGSDAAVALAEKNCALAVSSSISERLSPGVRGFRSS